MWGRINLLFLVVCFMKEDIFCDGFKEDAYDNTDKHAGPGGPPIPDMDSSHERPPIPDMDSSHERPPIPDMDSSHERPPIPDMDSNHERPPIPELDSSHERTPIPDKDANAESLPSPGNYGGEENNEKDNADPKGHRVGTILLVVLPVVGALVLIVGVICGICILKKRGLCIFKKRNHKKIKAKNFQDMGITEKHQIAFTSTAIYPDNPPPYTPTMEYGEIKSVPTECLGFSAGWYAPMMVNIPPSNTKIVN